MDVMNALEAHPRRPMARMRYQRELVLEAYEAALDQGREEAVQHIVATQQAISLKHLMQLEPLPVWPVRPREGSSELGLGDVGRLGCGLAAGWQAAMWHVPQASKHARAPFPANGP